MSTATRSYEDTVLVIRLPADLKAALRFAAAHEGKSMNVFVAEALGEKLSVPVPASTRVFGNGNFTAS